MSRFDECLAFTWRPDFDGQPYHVTAGDAGGATAWGVTLTSYASWRSDEGYDSTTAADLSVATKDELGSLYSCRFWNAVQGDHLPPGLDLLVYDFGVTSGTGTSSRLLQEVLGGLTVDGQLGPVTLSAAASQDRASLIHRLGARHDAYYRACHGFPRFGRGWLRRSAARLTTALSVPAPASATPAQQEVPDALAA